ncbi:MAG: hypothetical protein PHN31_01895 [Candidatus Gracilibacteria bacterium]|nr:hypothetical protein [Candidatus Gracilibacteria bacterium]
MKQIEVDKIISYLQDTIAISAITGDRIYFGKPISDIINGIYMTINILGEQQAFLNKGTLLEFRFIGHNTNVKFSELLALKNLVSEEFESNVNIDGFYSYNCYEESGFKNGYDEKNRKVIIQDYRFYFVK